MCNSVSFSVATWKLVTEKPVSSVPAKDGAEEPEPEPLPELPFETVPEIHFWVYSHSQYVQMKDRLA
jgi:hypothetical protein